MGSFPGQTEPTRRRRRRRLPPSGSSGLEADGVAGPVTAAALNEAFSERTLEYAATAEARIAAAVGAGRLDAATAEEAQGAVTDTVQAIAAQSPGSAAVLVLALRDVAAVADGYTTNRAALFEQLRVNVEALADGRPEMSLAGDVADGTGVVYRHFPEHGYQFHPLASFIRLNNLARKEGRGGGQLADALVARGVRSGKALLWQYRFTFGGPEVWTGFAQALGAQALARTGKLLGDARLTEAAAASLRSRATSPCRSPAGLDPGVQLLRHGDPQRAAGIDRRPARVRRADGERGGRCLRRRAQRDDEVGAG